jgi:hypothetical protein
MERILKRRASSKNVHSVESRQKEFAKRKVDRRERKIEELNQRIRHVRHKLHSVGRFSGAEDPALKEPGKLLDSTIENKLEFISANGRIVLDRSLDLSHINRMAMMVFHCKLQHRAKGLRGKTLPKFIQG